MPNAYLCLCHPRGCSVEIAYDWRVRTTGSVSCGLKDDEQDQNNLSLWMEKNILSILVSFGGQALEEAREGCRDRVLQRSMYPIESKVNALISLKSFH